MGTHIRERHDFVRILEVTPKDRKRIEAAIEMLIALLDSLDPDPDLEPCDPLEVDADFEPYMGSAELHPNSWGFEPFGVRYPSQCETRRVPEKSQEQWAAGHVRPELDEAEFVNEDGGNILDEPHDDDFDSEPWLGWGFHEIQEGPDWRGRRPELVDFEAGY